MSKLGEALFIAIFAVAASLLSATGVNAVVNVQNGVLVDEFNNQVHLIGANYGDHPRVFRTNNFTNDAQKIKDLGFNTIMLVKEWGALENSANSSVFAYNENEFQKMIQQINNFTQKGLDVIIKLHADNDTFGNGLNLKHFLGAQYCNDPGDEYYELYSSRFGLDFYNTSYLQDSTSGHAHLVKLWQKIAQMTRNNPKVIGFDLMNEPDYCFYDPSVDAQVNDGWRERVNELTSVLRNDDDDRLIFAEEAPFFNTPYKRFVQWEDPRTVSTIHWYKSLYKTPDDTFEACQGNLQTISNLWSNVSNSENVAIPECDQDPAWIAQAQEKYPDQPFLIGEFGNLYDNSNGDNDQQWIKNSIQLFKDTKMNGWFYWSSFESGTWINDIKSTMPVAQNISSYFDYILVIVFENHSLKEIIPSAIYLTNFANDNSLSTSYVATSSPSFPNYLSLLSGQTWGCDGQNLHPNSNDCTKTAWNSVNSNLVDRLESAGITWKAYMEGMPSNCYTNDYGRYAVRHNPFVYFSDIVNNASRCNKVVPAGDGDSALLNDLNSVSTAPKFMWLTPDLCNDMHDCNVSVGDDYFHDLIPKILNSNVFKNGRAALFVTSEEPGSGGDQLYTVFAGPTIKKSYQSSTPYNHYSFLKTVETNWNLPRLTSNDGDASLMNEFFVSGVPTTQPPKTNKTETVLVSLNKFLNKGETTNITNLGQEELENVQSLIFHIPSAGKIRFLDAVNLTKIIDVTKYELKFEGFDFDSANEVTVNINGQNISSLPQTYTAANNDKYVPFTIDITNSVKAGNNTIIFMQNSGASGIKNLSVSILDEKIFDNATAKFITSTANKTHSVSYVFSVGSFYNLNFDPYVNISRYRMEIRTDKLSFMDRSARLVFENVTLDNPRILRNGESCSDCVFEKYNQTEKLLMYRVPGFSVYTIDETPVTSPTQSGSGSGGGGSSSGGGGGGGGGGSAIGGMITVPVPQIETPLQNETVHPSGNYSVDYKIGNATAYANETMEIAIKITNPSNVSLHNMRINISGLPNGSYEILSSPFPELPYAHSTIFVISVDTSKLAAGEYNITWSVNSDELSSTTSSMLKVENITRSEAGKGVEGFEFFAYAIVAIAVVLGIGILLLWSSRKRA